jgi:hypothetical protein
VPALFVRQKARRTALYHAVSEMRILEFLEENK